MKATALAAWPGGEPLEEDVTVSITYFYDAEPGDVDNIIKPIQDAIIGLVYGDDSQVAKTQCQKSSIDGPFRVRGVSVELAVSLAKGRDFVRVIVDRAPDHEDLS